MALKNLHLGFIIFLISLISIEIGDFSLCPEQILVQDFEVATEIGRPERVVKKIQPKNQIKISNTVQIQNDSNDLIESDYSFFLHQPTLNFSISGAKQARELATSAS